MFDLPGREALTTLLDATRAVWQGAIAGLLRSDAAGRVHALYLSDLGIALHAIASAEAPTAFRPDARGVAHLGPDELAAHPDRAIEWQLAFYGARRAIVTSVPDIQPVTRFWVGLPTDEGPAPEQLEALPALAARAVCKAQMQAEKVASVGKEPPRARVPRWCTPGRG